MNRAALSTSAAVLASMGGVWLAVHAPSAEAQEENLRAVLRDPSGQVVGTVKFSLDDRGTAVKVRLRPSTYVAAGAFHGLHVHANGDATNGSGCVADAGQPSSTWFVSADGHLTAPGVTHGQHAGDLPGPLVMADGFAHLRFTTDRVNPADLLGRAVILHAKPDNLGNVPVGSEPNQYTPNGAAATDLTARTGNAGDRVACGVIERD